MVALTRRLRGVLWQTVMVAVLVAACGSAKPTATSTGGGGAGGSTTTASRTVAPSGARLRAALLTLPDLPAGWSVDRSGDFKIAGAVSGESICPAGRPLMPVDWRGKLPGSVGASFSDHGRLGLLGEVLASSTSMVADFTAAHRGFEACVGSPWKGTSQGPTTYSLRRLTMASHSQDHFAYQLVQASGPATLTVDLVGARDGDTVVLLLTSPGSLTPTELNQVLDKAVAKLPS